MPVVVEVDVYLWVSSGILPVVCGMTFCLSLALVTSRGNWWETFVVESQLCEAQEDPEKGLTGGG